MGLDQLIVSLKKSEQEQVAKLRWQMEAEAESIRKETAETIRQLTAEYDQQLLEAKQKEREASLAESDRRGKFCLLQAEQVLAKALYDEAGRQLSSLRNERYRDVFISLAAELPQHAWNSVTVNSQDIALARASFPNVRIQTDASITGGFVVETEHGKIVIDNTFEKRLDKSWASLLPLIMKDILEKLTGDEMAYRS